MKSESTLLSEIKLILSAVLLSALIFFTTHASDVFGNPETLTVTIAETVTFTTSTDSFGTLTPGTYKIATSTTDVSTNASSWHIQFYGDDQAPADTVMDLIGTPSVGITDQTEWVSPPATTTAGNAVTIASLDSSGDVLAFRAMSASGSVPFLSTDWWGSDDSVGNALWAGISSSTAPGNIHIGEVNVYGVSNYINTVQYYLDVPVTQQQGNYDAPLTYTWVTGT